MRQELLQVRQDYRPIEQLRGFTLLEWLIVIILAGILTSIGLTLYVNGSTNAKAQVACRVLRIIRDTERNYKLEKAVYLVLAESASSADWQNLRMENPNVVQAHTGYVFSVTVSPLQGKARRASDNLSYVINEAGTISELDAGGNPVDTALPNITF